MHLEGATLFVHQAFNKDLFIVLVNGVCESVPAFICSRGLPTKDAVSNFLPPQSYKFCSAPIFQFWEAFFFTMPC